VAGWGLRPRARDPALLIRCGVVLRGTRTRVVDFRSGPPRVLVEEQDDQLEPQEAPMADTADREPTMLEDAFAPSERLPELPPTDAPDERRIAQRIAIEGPMRYRFPTIPAASRWSHGVVVNLSATGGCLLVDGGWSLAERLEADEWVPLDVELHPGDGAPLRLRTEVMWVQPDGSGGVDRIGVRFVAGESDDMDRLAALVDELQQRS